MAATLAQLIADRAGRAPHEPYLLDAQGSTTVTRGRLRDAAAAWAARLADCPAGTVCLLSGEAVPTAVAFLGALAAGRDVAPLDGQAPAGPTAEMLERIRPAVVVTPRELDAAAFVQLPLDLPDRPASSPTGAGPGSLLLFSSGSTGPRKPVRLAESALLAAAGNVAAAHQLTAADRGLCPLPLHHVNAEVVGLLASLVSGGSLVLPEKFSRRDFWRCARDNEVTWLNLVPAVIAILSQAPIPRIDRIRFARSASAPLPAAVLERFEEAASLPVIETYGMTEAASQITANPLHGAKRGSVGKPVGLELEVRDVTGSPSATGQPGHVHIRGAQVIAAYADGSGGHNFDAGGWLDTGDVGYLDADGFLFLVGRATDVINNAGEKVFPREVEETLWTVPGVAEVAVIGRPDRVRTAVPVAYVTRTDEATDDLVERLLDVCRQALPRPARPVEIRVIDRMPLNATGKVSRPALRELDAELRHGSWQPAA